MPMKPSGLTKLIERKAKQSDKTPEQWLADYINEQGSILHAAEELKVSRQALSAKANQYGISTSKPKREYSVSIEPKS